MTVRELASHDLPELLALYEHLHITDAPRPTDGSVAALWASIQANPDLLYFGTFVENVLIASCTLTVIPNLTRGCRPYGVIENVVTHSAHRRQGHGRRTLEHTLAIAWERNCYKVMLLTGSKREAVYRFYESVGFDSDAKQAFLARPPQG